MSATRILRHTDEEGTEHIDVTVTKVDLEQMHQAQLGVINGAAAAIADALGAARTRAIRPADYGRPERLHARTGRWWTRWWPLLVLIGAVAVVLLGGWGALSIYAIGVIVGTGGLAWAVEL